MSAAFAPSPWLAWVKAKRTTSQTASDSSPGRPPRNANTRAWGKASATATSFAVGGGASAGRPAPASKQLSAVAVSPHVHGADYFARHLEVVDAARASGPDLRHRLAQRFRRAADGCWADDGRPALRRQHDEASMSAACSGPRTATR